LITAFDLICEGKKIRHPDLGFGDQDV